MTVDEADIIVAGGGAAGMMAALAACEHACTVMLVTNAALGRANTAMAQGGIQCPLPTEASLAGFVDDMRRSARIPVDEQRLRRFGADIPAVLQRLEQWGLNIARGDHGEYVRRQAGGMSEPRLVGVGEHTGAAIVKTLRRQIAACSALVVREHHDIVDLSRRDGRLQWRCRTPNGSIVTLTSRRGVICTGGMAYHEAHAHGLASTNPANGNAGMQCLLRERGLRELMPGEFQYQPLGLVASVKDGVGRAIPESLVGQSICITDRDGRLLLAPGERPDRLTLCQRIFAARDDGALITDEQGHQGVALHLDALPPGWFEAQYPAAHAWLARHGITDRPLVFPMVHYQLGGFEVDTHGRSAWPELFLAGEITGGLHGKNRLMGNGLADALVHGWRAGFTAGQELAAMRHEKAGVV